MIETRWLAALAILAGYAAFCALIAWRWRRRARADHAGDAEAGCLVA